MPPVAHLLAQRVNKALAEMGIRETMPMDAIQPTNNPAHGDYQTNAPFRLGKLLGKPPATIAPLLAQHFAWEGLLKAPPEVAGAGFVNFKLDDSWLGRDLIARSRSEDLGVERFGEGKTVVIDYSSPNVAKRMHVGHLRSTIIGHSLHRLHAAVGYKVVADNHIGDWGTQFGMLIWAWRNLKDRCPIEDDAVARLQWLYQEFKILEKEDPSLHEVAKAETVKLQAGDADNLALWTTFVAQSLEEFGALYARLGVRFDFMHGESFYHDALAPLVDELLASGQAELSEGAVIIRFTAADGKGLEDMPFLIRKTDGAFLYGTTDLATIRFRLKEWKPAKILYIVDVRQSDHFRKLFAAAKKLDLTQAELFHLGFGMLKLADGQILASRSRAQGSDSLNLVDVLDTAAERALAVVNAKSGHLSETERRAIAEAVGQSAIKYADLSQNPQTDITFDWDKMLAMEGNTAPYLMYAHARCCSILRKAAEARGKPLESKFVSTFLKSPEVFVGTDVVCRPEHPLERALAITLVRFPEQVAQAARVHKPNLVADHLFEVAQAFARFYGECSVLQAETEALQASRLALVAATGRVLARGLDLLGLVALERM